MQNDRKIRVAVASSDGIVVNSHFGRARDFYIYEVSENEDTVLLKSVSSYRSVRPVIMMREDYGIT